MMMKNRQRSDKKLKKSNYNSCVEGDILGELLPAPPATTRGVESLAVSTNDPPLMCQIE